MLVDLFGNPPEAAAGVSAVIVPPGGSVLDSAYVIVVTHDDEGHVSDEDAASIDHDDLLRDMQQATADDRASRTSAGYAGIELVGWAEAPHYDAATHKLYWARRLRFDGESSDTVNYEVRVLGREQTLELVAVADVGALDAVRTGMQEVLAASSFAAGRAYDDYEKGDRVSPLTVGGLVAGGAYAAAKTGLIAFLIAKAKLIVIGLAALGGAIWRRVRRAPAHGTTSAPGSGDGSDDAGAAATAGVAASGDGAGGVGADADGGGGPER